MLSIFKRARYAICLKSTKNIETGKFNIKQFLNDKDYSNYNNIRSKRRSSAYKKDLLPIR